MFQEDIHIGKFNYLARPDPKLCPIEFCELIEVHLVVPKTDTALEQWLLGRWLFPFGVVQPDAMLVSA